MYMSKSLTLTGSYSFILSKLLARKLEEFCGFQIYICMSFIHQNIIYLHNNHFILKCLFGECLVETMENE